MHVRILVYTYGIVDVRVLVPYLAGEAAEVEGLLEDPVAGEADVAGALEGPGLRPRLQEDHLGAVDRVRLHRMHTTTGQGYTQARMQESDAFMHGIIIQRSS